MSQADVAALIDHFGPLLFTESPSLNDALLLDALLFPWTAVPRFGSHARAPIARNR